MIKSEKKNQLEKKQPKKQHESTQVDQLNPLGHEIGINLQKKKMNSTSNRSSIESSNREKKTKPRDLYIAQLICFFFCKAHNSQNGWN